MSVTKLKESQEDLTKPSTDSQPEEQTEQKILLSMEKGVAKYIEKKSGVDVALHAGIADELLDNLEWENQLVRQDTGIVNTKKGYQAVPGKEGSMGPKIVVGNYTQEMERKPEKTEETSKVLNSVTDLVKVAIPVAAKAASVNPWVAAGVTAATLFAGSAALDRFTPEKEVEKPPVVNEADPINFGLEFVEPKIIKGQ